MKTYTLKREQVFKRPLKEVFSFFERPENLALITPKKLDFNILSPTPINMKLGTLIDYTIKLQSFTINWRTEITHYDPPFSFTDEQIIGPYAKWIHSHRFIDEGNFTTMIDEIYYSIPYGVFGEIAHALYVKNELKQIFDYRAKVISDYFNNSEEMTLVGG